MYITALAWSDQLRSEMEYAFGDATESMMLYFIFTAMLGMRLRLYIASLVILDHVRTGVRFRKVFPGIFILDATWAV